MGAQSVDQAMVTQFSDMVHIEAQQTQARLKPFVKWKPMKGDSWAYDSLGATDTREATGRNEQIVFSDIQHSRRKISRQRFYVALPIDGFDKLGMLLDPNEEYAKAVVSAMMRRTDRVIAAAAFADVLTGRDFGSTLTFAQDGGLTVDATAGLTYEKLLEINENYTDNEVGNDTPVNQAFCVTGQEQTALMKETELISGDFTRQFSVEKGQLVHAAGNELVKYGANPNNPILNINGSSQRECISLADDGICVGVSKELELKIQERPDMVDTWQVVAYFYLGAVRTEGKLVQKVTTTPT